MQRGVVYGTSVCPSVYRGQEFSLCPRPVPQLLSQSREIPRLKTFLLPKSQHSCRNHPVDSTLFTIILLRVPNHALARILPTTQLPTLQSRSHKGSFHERTACKPTHRRSSLQRPRGEACTQTR